MILDIKDIIIENRYRVDTEPEKIGTLADSISNGGLLQPIVVAQVEDKFYLVAGERRLKALETLGVMSSTYHYEGKDMDCAQVPAVVTKDMGAVERLQAEHDENVERVGFEWQEKTALSHRIVQLTQKKMNIQKAEAAEKAGDATAVPKAMEGLPRGSELERPAFKAAADTLAVSGTATPYALRKLQEEVALATALEDETLKPLISKAKSSSEAQKILKKVAETKINEALARKVGETFNAKKHTIEQGDCLLLSKKIPDNTFDICLTDPPYGINAHLFGDGAGIHKEAVHNYDDTPEYWEKNMPAWILMINRVLKEQSHIYIACDIGKFPRLKDIIEGLELEWQIQRKPLIHARSYGRIPVPEFSYRYSYECWLYARKGALKTRAVVNDVISTKSSGELVHGAVKDPTIYETFLRVSSLAGFKVFDPFAGSGSCLPPVHDASCVYHGMEVDPASFGLLIKKLKDLQTI